MYFVKRMYAFVSFCALYVLNCKKSKSIFEFHRNLYEWGHAIMHYSPMQQHSMHYAMQCDALCTIQYAPMQRGIMHYAMQCDAICNALCSMTLATGQYALCYAVWCIMHYAVNAVCSDATWQYALSTLEYDVLCIMQCDALCTMQYARMRRGWVRSGNTGIPGHKPAVAPSSLLFSYILFSVSVFSLSFLWYSNIIEMVKLQHRQAIVPFLFFIPENFAPNE